MKNNLKVLGHTSSREDARWIIEANSHSIMFGHHRFTKSKLKQGLKQGNGKFYCWGIAYVWELKNRGISAKVGNAINYRISPATYKKIVKWSKSK
ncbi:hypothetical protein LCGC14_2473490 [marine sediment metagenome]|uniref:Uncharacterized protein n=1 Tax=marine sediment metagenome TaxID=412755 RepID=A0A0F9B9K5_9ZZZZ